MKRAKQLSRSVLSCLLLGTLLAACGPVVTPPATDTPAANPTILPTRSPTTLTPLTATATPTTEASPTTEPSPIGEDSPTPPATVEARYGAIFNIPAGGEGDGIRYRGDNIPEMQRTGPAAFTVAQDGTFWILDTMAQRLLHYDPTGDRLGVVDLSDQQRSLIDVAVTDTSVYVLDAFPTPPLVIRLTSDGHKETEYALPEEFRLDKLLSGIAVSEHGELLIEKEGGVSLSRLLDDQGKVAPTPVEGYSHNGRLYFARPANIQAQDKTTGYIMAGDRRIEVRTTHFLGGLRILGFGKDCSVFVRIEEVMLEGEMAVDQTVHHYSSGGDLLGMARAPLAEQFTYVQQSLEIGPDGQVYFMLTQKDRVEIQRLKLTKEIEPVLPPPPTTTSRH